MLTYTTEAITCFKCHVLFWLREEHYRTLKRDGSDFYCPNGHVQHFLETTEKRHAREIEKLKLAHIQTKACLTRRTEALSSERRSHSATKGKHTKAMNRIRNGVCPFCRRTFRDVQRHMDSQHAGECKKDD